MINSIKISGFKKISEIELQDLNSINYLVGPNGCGKSSILESLIMIGKYGEPNANLVNRIIPILGNPKDLCNKSNASIQITGSNQNAGGLINSYELNPSNGNIITRSSDTQLALITRGFIFSNLRELSYFNNIIESTFTHSLFDVLRFDSDNIDSLYREQIVSFLNDYFFNEDRNEKKIERIFRSIDGDSSIQLEKTGGEIMNLKALSSGQLSLLGLYFSLISSIEKLIKLTGGDYVILLDEPENTLHPDLQKKVNLIFKRIIDEVWSKYTISLQFIISTHSPFIIKSIKKDDNTKIYLIKDGDTVNMRQLPGKKNGYEGSMCIGVASSMLGTGLVDLSPERSIPVHQANKLRVIFCEGSGAELDAIYYNIIFPEFNGIKNHFISCGGGVDVVMQYHIGKDLAPILGGLNIVTSALVDRSNSSPGFQIGDAKIITNGETVFSDSERDAFHQEYPSIKMLSRREIENYLFDPEILSLTGIPITRDIEMLDFKSGEIKNKLSSIPKLLELNKIDLAKRITESTLIYRELAECIFGS